MLTRLLVLSDDPPAESLDRLGPWAGGSVWLTLDLVRSAIGVDYLDRLDFG